MTDTSTSRVKMDKYRHSVIRSDKHDYMSKASPIVKKEEKHTYELVMLKGNWKHVPPMKPDQHTKLILQNNQEKLYYSCKCHKSWTIHSLKECRKQRSENRNYKRDTGKPGTYTSTTS